MVLTNITEITIYEAQTIKELLLKELEKQNDIDLEMGEIQKIDLVGIQLLLSLKNSLLPLQKKLTLLNTPQTILEQIQANFAGDSLGLCI